MNKVYLVINSWSNEGCGEIDTERIEVFSNKDSAVIRFREIKEEIKKSNNGYGEIEEYENYYCESENGEYLYYHDLVYIEEHEVQE